MTLGVLAASVPQCAVTSPGTSCVRGRRPGPPQLPAPGRASNKYSSGGEQWAGAAAAQHSAAAQEAESAALL